MHRNPARYAFVPLEGPVVMFEFGGAEHLAEGIGSSRAGVPGTVTETARRYSADSEFWQLSPDLTELWQLSPEPHW
jgi:hypothetical protein